MAALLWAYFAAVLVDPGRVPPGWHPFGSDEVPFFILLQHKCKQFLQCELMNPCFLNIEGLGVPHARHRVACIPLFSHEGKIG